MQRKGETAFFFCTAVSERNRMNSFMSWVGGKKALREAIVARLCCSCDRYVEVFGGGAWVLFHKLPGKFEVYNDFNPNLANLYRCVRDHPEELCEELRYTLNARVDFDHIREVLRTKTVIPDIRRAAYFYQIIRESYASGLDSFGAQPHNIPSSEHPKLGFITESCDDLSTCNVGLDPDLASFSRFPNDIVEDGLTKLKLLYRQNEPYTMAKVCLAICYYRDRMIGQEQEFSQYVRQMQAIYRPHRDTESAGLLGDNIRKQLFALEKELKETGAVTAVEQNIQNRKLLTLGLDCLRLCGAMEREQTAEQAEPLAMTM